MTTNTTIQLEKHNKPMKVKFIDANRHPNDDSFLAISSSIAFLTKAGDGLTLLVNERVSYQPGDKLLIKWSDVYGNNEAGTIIE